MGATRLAKTANCSALRFQLVIIKTSPYQLLTVLFAPHRYLAYQTRDGQSANYLQVSQLVHR